MAAIKNINDAIYALVSCLADNYGTFEADEAMEVIESWTDVNHIAVIQGLLKAPAKPRAKKEPAAETAKAEDAETAPETPKKAPAKPRAKKAPEPEPEKAPETPKKAPKEAKAAPDAPKKKEKNIPRWGKDKHGKDLKKALADANVEFSDQLEADFRKYAEELSAEDWKQDGKTYLDHMRDFAKTFGGPAEDKEPEPIPEEVYDVQTLDIPALAAIKSLVDTHVNGKFWDADAGRMVTGPVEEPDEDFTEPAKLGDKEYIVGETTGRVYEVRESGDVFAGFRGVGKFKDLKV
jgi:hypothetical protein